MNQKLDIVFRKIEKQREAIFHAISCLDDSQYNKSINGKWSIHQILSHLLTTERVSLSYMKKKSLGIRNAHDANWFDSFKTVLLKISQRIPLRYTAPRLVIEKTPLNLSRAELQQHWIESRKELKDFLESIEDRHLRKKIYKHTVAGRLNVLQALIFFREHTLHHLSQINRLLQ